MRIPGSSAALYQLQSGGGSRRAFEIPQREQDIETIELDRGAGAGPEESREAQDVPSTSRVRRNTEASSTYLVRGAQQQDSSPGSKATAAYLSVQLGSFDPNPEGELVGIDVFV